MQGAPLSASQLSTFAEGQSQDEVANSLDPSQWLYTQDPRTERSVTGTRARRRLGVDSEQLEKLLIFSRCGKPESTWHFDFGAT